MDLTSLSDAEILAAAGIQNPVSSAILGQESGNNPNIGNSIDGAVGRGQIIPSTFAQYAKPGEDINNDADNLAVHNRIIEDLSQKSNGDPARIAVGYFSGPGNIAPPDSPTPWKQDHTDGNGKSVSSYVSDVLNRIPKQYADSGQQTSDAKVDAPDVSKLSDQELLSIIGQPKPEKTNAAEDVAKSAIYRGIPEGLAASTLGGFGLNAVRGVSDLTRWAAGKAYKAIEGEDLPQYNANPIPSSSDILQAASKGLLGQDLYEPKTTAGQYANTIAQFGSGGAATGIPLRSAIPAAVASETAGQIAGDSEYAPAARILGGIVGGRSALRSSTPTLTADETKAASQAAYQDAANKGGILAPSFTNSILDTLEKNKAAPIAGKVLTSEDKALNSALGEYAALKDSPLTLSDYEKLDKSLGAKETAAMDGFKPTNNSRIIGKAQDEIRAKLNSLKDTDVVGGKSGFDALTQQAIPLYAKSARLAPIEAMVQKALSTDNPSTSLRKGFSSIVNNKQKFIQFNSEEQSALKQAAKTGVLGGSLRLLSSSAIPAIMAIGEDIGTGGYTGAVTSYALGKGLNKVAKSANTKLQLSKTNNALNVISSRGAAITPSPIQQLLQSQIQTKPRIRVKAGRNP